MNKQNWKDYWNKQQDPRHSVNQDSFFEKVAKEIEFHLGDLKNKKILEIGCGDGALLKFLPITAEQYVGVDFSDSLLKKFKKTYTDYKVQNIGGTEYLDSTKEKYDVIFSFGVLQYFNEQQLKELSELQKKHLNKGGFAFHFGVPIVENKKLFTSGKGIQNKTMFKPRSFAKETKSRLVNNIGNWHKLNSLCDITLEAGLEPHVFGGLHYLYRINLRQTN